MPKAQSVRSVIETAFKTNNESYIQKCYNENYTKVKSYIIQNNGTEQDAKDIYQEAFMVLWGKTSKGETTFDSESQVGGFLFQVAKHKWLDHLGSARVRKNQSINTLGFSAAIEEDTVQKEDEYEEQLSAMKVAFVKLGENCKKLLTKFYFEKKSMVEI